MPKIAVCLAVYNGENWLKEQISSILAQKNVDLTLIISIDDSNDQSESICREYAEKHCNIVMLQSGCRFGNAALNFFRLLSELTVEEYDYIALSDQDDIWCELKLSVAIDSLKKTSSDGYSSNLKAFDESNKKVWVIKKNRPQKDFDYLFQGASAGCTYVLSRNAAVIVQRQLQHLNLEVCSRPSHDWTIYAICRSFGLRWFFDNGSYIKYRVHAGNFYSTKSGVQQLVRKRNILSSGWYKKQILLLKDVIKYSKDEEEIFFRLENRNWKNILFLIGNVHRFRRRRRDQIALIAILLFYL